MSAPLFDRIMQHALAKSSQLISVFPSYRCMTTIEESKCPKLTLKFSFIFKGGW